MDIEYNELKEMIDTIHTTAAFLGYKCLEIDNKDNYMFKIDEPLERGPEDNYFMFLRISIGKTDNKLVIFYKGYYTTYPKHHEWKIHNLQKVLKEL